MKKALLIPAMVVLAIVLACIYSNSFMFQPVTTLNCLSGEISCIKNVKSEKGMCIPSSTVIHGRDGILLMVNITREGNKCVRNEKVIGSEKPENSYLVGHNVTCEYDLSQLDNASATACPGSLYDYVMPAGGETGGASKQPGIPKLTCGIDDYACKDIVTDYLSNCRDSEIVTTEPKWQPSGYWTAFIKIKKYTEACQFYFEVLNAVNLPPGVPSSIIGSSMTCDVPLSELPVGNFTSSWCTGELYNYINQLAY